MAFGQGDTIATCGFNSVPHAEVYLAPHAAVRGVPAPLERDGRNA